MTHRLTLEYQIKSRLLRIEARGDILAYTVFPKKHGPQIASTNPLERLYGKVKRRYDFVRIFPNALAARRGPRPSSAWSAR